MDFDLLCKFIKLRHMKYFEFYFFFDKCKYTYIFTKIEYFKIGILNKNKVQLFF